jgi:hypothetical protein
VLTISVPVPKQPYSFGLFVWNDIIGINSSSQGNNCFAIAAPPAEDGAFEDDGEATIWFEPVDRREQERTDEDDHRDIKRS